ncbi:hypothetical protein PENTCL1PPCAC_9458, partial [Pristionchus entomophagus]
ESPYFQAAPSVATCQEPAWGRAASVRDDAGHLQGSRPPPSTCEHGSMEAWSEQHGRIRGRFRPPSVLRRLLYSWVSIIERLPARPLILG